MKINYRETSTKMPPEKILEIIFPTQVKYREITKEILNLFIEKGSEISGRSELQVDSVVRILEERGHNKNTVYKVMREYLVPMGIINWKKFEGSIQLSKKFGNSLRRLSISWNNFISRIEKGKQKKFD